MFFGAAREGRAMAQSVFDELKWRGLIYDNTESAPEMLAHGQVTAYTGFDATAERIESLSVTSLQNAKKFRFVIGS
jgi:hypothetical protein